jgi:hypothetical protein
MERKSDPKWSRPAPEGAEAALDTVKKGVVLGSLVLSGEGDPAPDRHCHLLGRTPLCDFVLEHASISRQHAFLGWDERGQLLLVDLGSAHGTCVDRRACTPGVAVQLADGSSIQFGASSRSYVVRLRTKEQREAAEVAAAEEEAAASRQDCRRLCAVHLSTTCGEDGETSASAGFAGPAEVVRISAVLLDTEARAGLRVGVSHPPPVLGTFSTLCCPAINPLLSSTAARRAACTQVEIDGVPPFSYDCPQAHGLIAPLYSCLCLLHPLRSLDPLTIDNRRRRHESVGGLDCVRGVARSTRWARGGRSGRAACARSAVRGGIARHCTEKGAAAGVPGERDPATGSTAELGRAGEAVSLPHGVAQAPEGGQRGGRVGGAAGRGCCHRRPGARASSLPICQSVQPLYPYGGVF